MSRFKKILGIVTFTLGIISALAPMLYWIMNPELTQMVIFIKFWWLLLLTILITLLFVKGLNQSETQKIEANKRKRFEYINSNECVKLCSESDKMVQFMVNDYINVMVGRYCEKGKFYYLQRVDNRIHAYDVHRVHSVKELTYKV